jgi:hypothetical protein
MDADEQPLVVKMLSTMLNDKKTVGYLQEQNDLLPSSDAIKKEFQRE